MKTITKKKWKSITVKRGDSMKFETYVRILKIFLRSHWAVAKTQLTVKKYTIEHGYVGGRIILLDGSYIDFSEERLIVEKTAAKPNYRYEYVKDKAEIFRYDNSAKHSGIRPPYHHKHISKRRAIQVKEAPRLIDVIEEALRYMF